MSKQTQTQINLTGLKEYCNTARQIEVLNAVIEADGVYKNAAKKLDITHQTVSSGMRRIRARAAAKGWSPEHDMTKKVPEGFGVKGTSTMYGKDGEIKLQWVKTQRDAEEQLEIMQETIKAMCQEVPRMMPVPAPMVTNDDWEVHYPIGDYHLGMMAWGDETGLDYDLKVAEKLLPAAMQGLLETTPDTTTALIVNLGDFFHSDNTQNRTAHSGNALDVDSRWAKIIRIGVNLMRQCIDMALVKHKKVKVINAIGNHDEHSSQWLAVALQCLYENEPRVEIVVNPSVFSYHKFGKNLIGVTHTHTVKGTELESIMAHDCNKEWGETEHRSWYVGHLHHKQIQEYRGCTVEVFNTLAGRDAWHNNAGYRSKRTLTAVIVHKEHGEVGRNTVKPQMFE